MLLYYTGLRRVAKGILQEVVRGMFLNRAPQLRLLEPFQFQIKPFAASETVPLWLSMAVSPLWSTSWRGPT